MDLKNFYAYQIIRGLKFVYDCINIAVDKFKPGSGRLTIK